MQLVAVDGVAELSGEGGVGGRLAVHGRLVAGIPVLAAIFRAVHGDIGPAKQLAGVDRLDRDGRVGVGQADAGVHDQVVAGHVERGLQRLGDPGDRVVGRVGRQRRK